MVRMTTRCLCIVAVLIVFIPLYLILNHSDHDENSYGVIMDAGSTGTRLFLYTWTSNSDNELIEIGPVLDHSNNHVVKKVYPGLSSFQDRPEEAADYVKPLLDYASQFIPVEKLPYTPVFLLATAGMRLIPEEQQIAILTNLHTKLPQMTTMQIMKEHIRVIEGKWEGIYSWIAVNYILGKFKATNSPNTSRPDTVGMIDMGGASMQIAFEMSPGDDFRSSNVENVNLGCRDDDDRYKYKLFVTTFLGYGVNEGLRKYEQELSDRLLTTNGTYIRDECMPVNLQKVINRSDGSMFVRKGIGDWDGCVKRLAQLLNNLEAARPKSLCKPNCFFGNVAAPMVISIVSQLLFAIAWWTLQSYPYRRKVETFLLAAARRKLYPKSNEDRLKSQCFKSAWITAILHDGFDVDREHNNFQSAFNIAGQEVQWALGAMIYHMRYFPLRNSATNLVITRHASDSSLPFSFNIKVGMRRNRSIWSYMMMNPSDTSSFSSLRSVAYG
ncbi:unnamed protein product [Angiostrongylus costaricensis]|uniref:Nucleoside-diphosphatase mig-23 n=1 Tax=Angiostrongylus costaricensis TaxID=334426 RepID=A0A0R3PUX2_ANGCS|nr:unnamed protein product [Angiostrongylus costaricensis]